MIFCNNKHKEFYNSKMELARVKDCYTKSIIYILGTIEETRENFNKIYDLESNTIIHESINLPFQTGTSLVLTRLAFNLFNDTYYDLCNTNENSNEIVNSDKYTPVNIFQYRDLMLYMFEGIKIRFEVIDETKQIILQ